MKNGQSVSFISIADFISDRSTQEAVYQQWPRDHHYWVWCGRVSHGNSASTWWPTSYSHWARLERTRQDCWGAASTRRAGCFGQTWAERLLSRLLLKWKSFFFQGNKIKWRKKLPFFCSNQYTIVCSQSELGPIVQPIWIGANCANVRVIFHKVPVQCCFVATETV